MIRQICALGGLALLGGGCGSSNSSSGERCDGGKCRGALEASTDARSLSDGGGGGRSAGCANHQADCDGNAANGCEVQLDGDAKNCGACGHDCLGGDCVGGQCQPFQFFTVPSGAGQIVTPTAIAADGTNVYVGLTDTRGGTGGSIIKFTATGGAPQTLARNLPAAPSDILVDGATLYYGFAGGSSSTAGSVWRISTAGGTPLNIAGSGGYRLALDPSRIYWTDNFSQVARTSRNRVERGIGAGDAGAIETLATGSIPQGIAVDATSVYWAAAGGDALLRLPIDGGSAVTMATIKSPREVKVNTTHVFCSSQDSYELGLRRIPFGVGTTLKYVSAYVVDFAIDADFVYWLETGPHKVMKSPIDSANPMQLATPKPLSDPGRIALDATAIYYTLGAGQDLGQIMKIAK